MKRTNSPCAYSNKFSENDSHSCAEESRCVSLGCVGGMNRYFYIRPKLDTLRQTQAVERLKHALMVFSRGIRLGVIEYSTEHVSLASEWVHLRESNSVFIFDGR